MFNLASLFVTVGARTGPFDNAMSRMHRSLGSRSSALGKAASDSASGALGRMGSALSAKSVAIGTMVGNLAATGITRLASAAINGVSNSVNSAMDLGETVSKVNTVFGQAAGSVTGQADQMAEAFGLAKQPMLDAAAMFGLMGQGAGMAQGASAEFSNTMVKLAADAQSFYNVPLESALEKIRAGLSGESEPLRAFGVFLTEDAMKAEALSMGLIKAGESMTESQKIMARASLIQKGLATASGDLERTQDSASNQTRKLWGTLGNLSTEIGQTLLPLYGLAVAGVNSFVDSMRSGFKAAQGYLASFTEGVKAGVGTIGVMWRNLPIVWEMVAVQFHAGVVNMLNWLGTLPANAGLVAGWLGSEWVSMISDALMAVVTLFGNLGENIEKLWNAVLEYIATGEFHVDWTPMMEGFRAETAALPEFVKAEVYDATEELNKLAEEMAGNEATIAQAAQPAKTLTDELQKGQKAAEAIQKATRDSASGVADYARKLAQAQEGYGQGGNRSRPGGIEDRLFGAMARAEEQVREKRRAVEEGIARHLEHAATIEDRRALGPGKDPVQEEQLATQKKMLGVMEKSGNAAGAMLGGLFS